MSRVIWKMDLSVINATGCPFLLEITFSNRDVSRFAQLCLSLCAVKLPHYKFVGYNCCGYS